MSVERGIACNTLWLTLQPLTLNVLGLGATMYLTRRLGADEWGQFSLCLAFVAMFTPLANLGVRTPAYRQAAKHRETASVVMGHALVLRTLLALVTALLLIAAAPLAGRGEVPSTLTVMAVGLVIGTVWTTLVDAFHAFEVIRPASMAQLLGGCLLTAASVLVVWAGGGIRELAMAYALGPICTLALLLLWSRGQPFRPRLSWNPAAMRDLLRQGRPFFGLLLLAEVSMRLDIVALSRLLSGSMLGCYTAAMSMVDRSMMVVDGASTALFPALAQLSARSTKDAEALLRKAALYSLAVTLPIALLCTVFAPQAIALVFGSQYAQAAPILAVGIWRLPMMALALLCGHALFAAGRQDIELRTNAISMLAGLALLYPLLCWLGPMGGALASIVRHTILWMLRVPALRLLFPRLWPWDRLARLGISLGFMGLPLLFVPLMGPGFRSLVLVPVAGIFWLLGLASVRLISPSAAWAYLRRFDRFSGGRAARSCSPAGAPNESVEERHNSSGGRSQMLSYYHIVRSRHPAIQGLRRARNAIWNFTLPAPRLIALPSLILLWVYAWTCRPLQFLWRVLVCEPVFKARCKVIGRGVKTDIFIHSVKGQGDIFLGDDVLMDGKCFINFAARFSERPTLRVGDHSGIGHGCSFTIGKQISIGRHCRVASQVLFFDSPGHPLDPEPRQMGLPPSMEDVKPITIEDNVWIGRRAIIYPGVTIGQGSVVATGSVVTNDVPAYTLVAGNPARRVMSLQPPLTECEAENRPLTPRA